jgi:hypothetical protein
VEGWATDLRGTGTDVNHCLGTRGPESHVIVFVLLFRISESGLLVGVVTIRVLVLIFFILVILNVDVELILIVVVVVVFIVLIIVKGCILVVVVQLLLFLQGLLFGLSSEATDMVLLSKGIVDGKLSPHGIALATNPVVFASCAPGKLVELGAIRGQIGRVSTEKLGP